MWSAVTQQEGPAASSLQGLGVSQPLTEQNWSEESLEGSSHPLHPHPSRSFPCLGLLLPSWVRGQDQESDIGWGIQALILANFVTLGRFRTSLRLLVSLIKGSMVNSLIWSLPPTQIKRLHSSLPGCGRIKNKDNTRSFCWGYDKVGGASKTP